ncbi:MAG: DNA repair protein RecO [Oscillospiraceae bacterium]|nr:DNA repair protein RecO [Oscillospiraceae bacterium]
MKTSTDGIVIWEIKTGEADRVVTILTDTGLITAYSRGSLRPKNKLTSPTAMLSYSNFELRSGKNMFNIDDALSKERFIRIASDITKYSLAVYFCELLKNLAPIDDDSSEYLSLMLNSLHLLNEGKKDILHLKAVFELRIMSMSGYMPDLETCAGCGVYASERLFFDYINGVWYCEDCVKNGVKAINCTGSILHAMRHVIYSEKNRIFSFELLEKQLGTLSKLASSFVVSHIERSPATLDFLNSITDG